MRLIKTTIVSAVVLSSVLAVQSQADDKHLTRSSSTVPRYGSTLQSTLHSGHRSELPTTYFQLACLNCEQGDKSEAAKYIERGIAGLVKRSKETSAHNAAALKKSIADLRYQAGRLRAGHAVSAAKLKKTIGKANQAFVKKTQRVAGEVGYRSAGVLNATAGFGHSVAKDTKRDVRYAGHRVHLLGGRMVNLVTAAAFATTGH